MNAPATALPAFDTDLLARARAASAGSTTLAGRSLVDELERETGFEPLLMAAIGLVVGAIVVLLYMPIFDLAGDMS